jgi:cysteinyl-tRNA synthetase
MALRLHNTLTGTLDTFTPIDENKVTLYTCGPTVYNFLHVGNWTAYVYWDTLVRTLIASGYKVERVMNITDVGHLVSDADEGEDKLEKGARREGKTAWEVAEFYAEDFLAGMEKLGLLPPEHLVRATDFIAQQFDLVRILKEKGYTYQTTDGIYFDTAKFPTYANFAHLDLEAQKAGARVEANDQKRQPWDFALWKFTEPGVTRDMQWETPDDLLELGSGGNKELESDDKRVVRESEQQEEIAGDFSPLLNRSDRTRETATLRAEHASASAGDDASGKQNDIVYGFPGWHLECSAMAMSILSATIDIHTGGIDHIPVHHTNEIAQSEAASGVRFANYWLHNNHLKIDGGKISKSLGNGYTLQNLDERGFSPLDLRMFILQGQYTNEGNFTFENLEAAQNRLKNWRNYAALRHQTHDGLHDDNEKNDDSESFVSIQAASGAVREALQNNLNTPEALRIVDNTFAKLDNVRLAKIHRHGLASFLETVDELLGLQLLDSTPDISDDMKRIIIERKRSRDTKDWHTSDTLRDELAAEGIMVRDTAYDTIWTRA